MNKKKIILWVSIGIGSFILAAIILCVSYFYHALGKIDFVDRKNPTAEQTQDIKTEEVNKSKKKDEVYTVKTIGNSSIYPAGNVVACDNVKNILLLGTDERTNNFSTFARADSMMILSLDLKNNTAKLISLERGMGVPIPGREDDWITHVFQYGGAELLMETIENCFKIKIDNYVRVNFTTFEKTINILGGVDINLTELEAKGLNNEVYTNAVTKHKVKPGMNHLDGYDALQYARIRYIDSDWRRIERQRNLIQAIIDETKDIGIKEITTGVNEILPLVRTDLKKQELVDLIFKAPNFLGVKLDQKTIPEKGTFGSKTVSSGRSMFDVDFNKNASILQEFFYGNRILH